MALTKEQMVEEKTMMTAIRKLNFACNEYAEANQMIDSWAYKRIQELNKMEQEAEEVRKYRGGKYVGIRLQCEHCRKEFALPYRHYEPHRDIDGVWDSEDWDECPYCHRIITGEWLDKLKEENKK